MGKGGYRLNPHPLPNGIEIDVAGLHDRVTHADFAMAFNNLANVLATLGETDGAIAQWRELLRRHRVFMVNLMASPGAGKTTLLNGLSAFINGKEVGYNETIGPYQAVVPPGTLREGDNEIVLKITGSGAAPRSGAAAAT